MLFSTHFTTYECTRCRGDYTNVTPTSVIPTAGCCVVAGGIWADVMRRHLRDHWTMYAVGFVVAFGSLWLIFEIIERLTNRALRARRCPDCGAQLKSTGGGFSDGMTPAPWEIVAYVLTIVVSIVVKVADHSLFGAA